MEPTERRFRGWVSIGCLLALSVIAGAAPLDAHAGDTTPSSAHPGLSAALAERPSAEPQPGATLWTDGSLRNAIELMVLAAICGIVVAFCSAGDGGQRGKRVPMRTRRR